MNHFEEILMRASDSATMPAERRYDLDWVRTLVVLLVLPFHSLLVFVQDPGSVVYLKDTLDCIACDQVAGFIAVWQMQALFVIAGMSTFFALSKRSGGQYLLERVTRLLVPFLFGVVTVVPLMTYVTQLGRGKSLTIWQHYTSFFMLSPDLTGLSGTFTPAHLWFILFLFFFSVVALPLFLMLRMERSLGILRGMAQVFTKPGGLLLLGLPIAAAGRTEILGAQNPIYYIVVFITGYLLVTDSRYQKAIARDWPVMLALGVLLEILRQTGWPNTVDNTMPRAIRDVVLEYNSWVWVLGIFGLGGRFLNFGSRTLRYLLEASFPFYILHLLVQTVVTSFIVRFSAGIVVKYMLLVIVSFVITFLVYEAARRIAPLRFLLGMKAQRRDRAGVKKGTLARV
jgi:glucans biosynthesis protein C